MMKKPKCPDLRGKVLNNWKVLEQTSIRKSNGVVVVMLKCECIKCGNINTQPKAAIMKSKGSCVKCINLRSCPHGNVTESYLAKVRQRAKAKKWEYSVSTKYLSELFNKQNGKCVYTGRELKFGTATNFRNGHQTASLDRIDSSKGYVEGNVQWVHKRIQPMKLTMSHDEFISTCCEVSNNARKENL